PGQGVEDVIDVGDTAADSEVAGIVAGDDCRGRRHRVEMAVGDGQMAGDGRAVDVTDDRRGRIDEHAAAEEDRIILRADQGGRKRVERRVVGQIRGGDDAVREVDIFDRPDRVGPVGAAGAQVYQGQ